MYTFNMWLHVNARSFKMSGSPLVVCLKTAGLSQPAHPNPKQDEG